MKCRKGRHWAPEEWLSAGESVGLDVQDAGSGKQQDIMQYPYSMPCVVG